MPFPNLNLWMHECFANREVFISFFVEIALIAAKAVELVFRMNKPQLTAQLSLDVEALYLRVRACVRHDQDFLETRHQEKGLNYLGRMELALSAIYIYHVPNPLVNCIASLRGCYKKIRTCSSANIVKRLCKAIISDVDAFIS